MKPINVLCAAVLGVVVVLGGCAGSKSRRLVNWYGTYAVDEEMQLKITTLGMSQIQYELRHRPSDRVIVKSSGSSFQGWFFVWEDAGRLWGYWNDVGTIVWIPDNAGEFQSHTLYRGSPLLKDLPREVAAHMPDWAKRSLGI